MSGLLHRALVLLALSGLLSGCLTTAEQRAEQANERCVARGYQPKTDAFSDCLVRLETERQLRVQTREREMMEKTAIPSPNRGN